MKELKIVVSGKEYVYTIPETWADLTQSQYEDYVRIMGRNFGGTPTRELMIRMCGIGLGSALVIGSVQWYELSKELEWMMDITTLDGLLEEVISINGEPMIGYEPDFSNTTWAEFVDADTFAMRGQKAGLASVLYRPKREVLNDEEDVRIPYTAYGAMNRREKFEHLSPVVLEAAYQNYMVLRKRLTERYTQVFVERSEGEVGETFSWLNVTKTLVGDKIGEWEAYQKLPVDVVLSRINAAIKEQREIERKMRK